MTKGSETKPRQAARPVTETSSVTEAAIRRMPASAYMNEVQLEFFRQRLLAMREELLPRVHEAKERMRQTELHADPADRATDEEEHALDMRLRERETFLMKKIEESLRRIKTQEYGYCVDTGEPIGIPRLLVRPTATQSVDSKDRAERMSAAFSRR